MTDNTTLIAEWRSFGQRADCRPMGRIGNDLADALEAAEASLVELAPERDERIIAWERIVEHPVFRPCFDEERPLLDSMLDRLAALESAEAENARLHAEVKVAFDDRDAALERLGLEVAGRVELAAVIEAVRRIMPPPKTWAESLVLDFEGKPFPQVVDAGVLGRILSAAPSDVLRARDAEKRAEWEAEQGVKRQFTAAYRARNGNVIALDTPTVVQEHAAKTASEFAEEDPEGPDYFVATRILPPWLPVTNTESEGTA